MNFHHDKDAIIHRLQTHITILEQQHNSQGYFSHEETPSIITEHYSIDANTTNDNAATLEKLLQKREYELAQLRQQLNDIRQEDEEKLHRTIAEFNDLKSKYSSVESERNHLRHELQRLQDENDLLKTYMNRLPSEIEYEKLRQSHEILSDQLKQSHQTNNEYRQEKIQLKKQLITYQHTIAEQTQTIQSHQALTYEKSFLNAKSLTIDERKERDEKFDEFNRIIEQLKERLQEEITNKKHQTYVNEQNVQTVQSLTDNLAKKEQTIKEMNTLLRQNRQELADIRVELLVSEEQQTRLNERLLNSNQLCQAIQRVRSTIEKLILVLDFASEMLNNQSGSSSPDVLMLQLSTHKNKSDPIDSLNENLQKCQISDVENLECKLDEIIDRLLSIRSELIARQFENDLQSNIPCRLQ